MALTQQELVEQLKRQLVFLENSSAAFDAGHQIEAIRIGVILRVLFHDTGKSTSLLKLLGQKGTVQVVTSAKKIPAGMAFDFGVLLAGEGFGDTIYPSPLEAGSPSVTADRWWKEEIFTRDGVNYTREQVALAAAHKDGGAHVDEPDADLKAFREPFWQKTTTHPDGTKTQEGVDNNHFRMLRRLADELLNSPDLKALAI